MVQKFNCIFCGKLNSADHFNAEIFMGDGGHFGDFWIQCKWCGEKNNFISLPYKNEKDLKSKLISIASKLSED
jgi:transcription elongation factor Elf1